MSDIFLKNKRASSSFLCLFTSSHHWALSQPGHLEDWSRRLAKISSTFIFCSFSTFFFSSPVYHTRKMVTETRRRIGRGSKDKAIEIKPWKLWQRNVIFSYVSYYEYSEGHHNLEWCLICNDHWPSLYANEYQVSVIRLNLDNEEEDEKNWLDRFGWIWLDMVGSIWFKPGQWRRGWIELVGSSLMQKPKCVLLQ